MNGKIDLSQAEGIADLIVASSKASHDMAINQTAGAFSKEIAKLRDSLTEFAALLELELDFTDEDVEFADRTKLTSLCDNILRHIGKLTDSYARGAVLKDGVPVVIAGIPNAGKSSLLNLLANDEKAIVTEIPGTTRDIIEDPIEIDGILYRFFDTAGLRETDDLVEGIGVQKAKDALEKAYIIIWVIDSASDIKPQIDLLADYYKEHSEKNFILLLNKSDMNSDYASDLMKENFSPRFNTIIPFSTKTQSGLTPLLQTLNKLAVGNSHPESDVIVANVRHFEALIKASEALKRGRQGLVDGIPSDFVAQEIREVLHYLGTLTGTITTDNLLSSIFSRFCIGK